MKKAAALDRDERPASAAHAALRTSRSPAAIMSVGHARGADGPEVARL